MAEEGVDSNEKLTTGTGSGGDASEESGFAASSTNESNFKSADKWIKIGAEAANNRDYKKAAVCFGRALQIRTAHHGEDALDCANTYHTYGRVLLNKARNEADPTSSLAKKEREFREYFKEGATYGDTTDASVSAQQGDAEGKDEECILDSEDLFGSDKDQSDLDLANKMLEKARDITMKYLNIEMSGQANFIDNMSEDQAKTVYVILSGFVEVTLARENFESIRTIHEDTLLLVERMFELDIAIVIWLYSRLCVYLESAKPLEGIDVGQRAISVCEDGMKRIKAKADIESVSSPASTSAIERLKNLCAKMRQKVKNLQTIDSNAGSGGNIESQSDTDIGTSGKGFKRESTSSAGDPSPTKKRSTDSPPNKGGDGCAS